MTVLYKPVLIESAEQAEALPDGTVAYLHDGITAYSAVKRADGGGYWLAGDSDEDDEGMVGWTALVSVEAEKETRDHPGIMLPTSPPQYPQQTRYVTPWEEA